MGIFERLDHWLGKTLFVPVIIRICQRAGMTQYRFHRYGLFAAGLYGVGFSEGWLAKGLFAFIALIFCLGATLLGDMPEKPSARFWRLLPVFMLVLLAALLVPTGKVPITTGFWLLCAFAEYALTIKTIPPLEAKEPKKTRVMATAKAKA